MGPLQVVQGAAFYDIKASVAAWEPVFAAK